MKKIFKTWTASWTILLLVLSLSGTSAYADRIKDLTTVAAMRSNQQKNSPRGCPGFEYFFHGNL